MDTNRKKSLLLTLVFLILSLTLVAANSPGDDRDDRDGRRLTATLSGEAEVPGPGDQNGTGEAVITLNPGKETVCWKITVSRIDLPATAAHIHEGEEDEAGPVLVTLSPPNANGKSSGCTSVDRDDIRDILHDPDEYYVNVHNEDFPDGAVRGQLDK